MSNINSYVIRVHLIGSNDEERGNDVGVLASSQEVALAAVAEKMGDTWDDCYYSSISVFPLKPAEITQWRYEKGKGMQANTFNGYATVGGGHLAYIVDGETDEDTVYYLERCKATFTKDKIKCMIFKDNHDVKFLQAAA
jgi:hypothetical protein